MAENIVELLTDVADAIREKKGTTEKINAQAFAEEIKNLPSGSAPRWTGHADADGLRAIGWDDDDIAYYQEHGVNWNEEDDQYHKVSDDNKALYGVLTADNIADYKDRIVYLPKIDTSAKTSLSFESFSKMVAIPMIDTSAFTTMGAMFRNCATLTCVPNLDTSKVKSFNYAFQYCYSLSHVALQLSEATNSVTYMFQDCFSLLELHLTKNKSITSINNIFYRCCSLGKLVIEDASTYTNATDALYYCFALQDLRINSLAVSINAASCFALSMSSLLYIIMNEKASSEITIKLRTEVYDIAMEDANIQAALAAHPNILLAK